MKKNELILKEARWMLEHRGTVRSTGKEFGIPKSTVHKHMTKVLPRIDKILATQVFSLLGVNKSERHIRGGTATRLKYARMCAGA